MEKATQCNCVHRYLSASFRVLGESIAKHPFVYCFVPLLCNSVLSIGFLRIRVTKDIEYLYSPINGRARTEREAVESLFPPNRDEFDLLRDTRLLKRMNTVMIEPTIRGSALREVLIGFLREIDEAVNNITVVWENETLQYRDICYKTAAGGCYLNEILSLRGKIGDVKRKRLRIRYPFDNGLTSDYRFSISNMGGVTLDGSGYVEDVKALRLIYVLKSFTATMDKISEIWQNKLLEVVSGFRSDYAKTSVTISRMLDNEFHRTTETALPLSLIAAPLMLAFAVITCLTKDCVTSKPWVGIAGCLTPIIGTAGAFGLLILCGAEYLDLNIMLAFLLTGIGLDDSFVILAAWRRSNPSSTIIERTGQAYSEAAASITITSLTNIFCFCVGLTTSYRVVRIFSLYAATSLLFGYICQLTFFGSILALTGYREKSNRHSLFCVPVKRNSKKQESPIVKCLYYGWSLRENASGAKRGSSFYRENLGSALTKSSVKVITLVLFLLYLAGAVYSIGYVQQRFLYISVIPYYSYARNSITKYYKYFSQYPHPVNIVINETLDYSSAQTRKEVEDIIRSFTSAPNMAGEEIVDSWLKYYVRSWKDRRLWLSYKGYNMSNPRHFLDALQNVFLKVPVFRRYSQDILFNENKTEIIATRYIVSSKDIFQSYMEKDLVETLWKIADSCKYEVYVHNFWFLISTLQSDIAACTIQTMCIAVLGILLVFFVFMPKVGCVICVAFTVASTQTGVIGYMSLLGVSLDPISMITVIMSAGLCVDYAAHVSFAYSSCAEENPDEKLKTALHAAGHPVIQGCLSTILGVAALALAPCDSIIIFSKVVSLVMTFSGIHALFILPILLSTWDKAWPKVKYKYILLLRRKEMRQDEKQVGGIKEKSVTDEGEAERFAEIVST